MIRRRPRRFASLVAAAALATTAPASAVDLDVKAWKASSAAGAAADYAVPADNPSVGRATIKKPGQPKQSWQIGLEGPSVKVAAGEPLVFRFRARADKPRSAQCILQRAHDKYDLLGLDRTFNLDEDWKTFRFKFKTTDADDAARIRFNLAGSPIAVEISDLSLQAPAAGEVGALDVDSWKIYAKEEAAKLDVIADVASVMRVTFEPKAKKQQSWEIRLDHPGLSLQEGTGYSFSFRARADAPRKIRCRVAMNHSPWKSLGFDREFDLDKDWKNFGLRFRGGASDADCLVTFSLGASDVPVEISDVFLKESAKLKPGMIDPGDWKLAANGDNRAELFFSPDTPEVLRIVVDRVDQGRIPWQISLQNFGVSLSANVNYVLSFRARAKTPRAIICGVSQAHPPWKNLGLLRNFILQREWQSFQETFTPEIDESNAQIRFDLGNSEADVELADVSLVALDVPEEVVDRRRPLYVNLAGMAAWLTLGGLFYWRFGRMVRPPPVDEAVEAVADAETA